MKLFLNVVSIILLLVMLVGAIIYLTTGVYYSISGVAVILFIITVEGYQKYKRKQ